MKSLFLFFPGTALPKKMPKVFVIVLNYNGKDTLIKCLNSIFKSDYPNFEMVLVDNNSDDGSFEQAKKSFSNIYFIKNRENIGFGPGNNVGIRFSLEKMADYIFLLNNDAIIQENTLSVLVGEGEKRKDRGIFSPIIFNQEKIWFSGGKINWLKMKAFHTKNLPNRKISYETEYVTGCAMLIKKEVFKRIGLFDENFFLYYEDTDFCVRSKRAGYISVVIPSSRIQHLEKSESNKKNKIYWLVLSGIIFFKKNTPPILRPWTYFYLLLRRIKNRIDLWRNKGEIAENVNNAYKEYSRWKKESTYLS